jgi:hypothetical protein
MSEFYYSLDGGVLGPVSLEGLYALWNDKTINDSTLILKTGDTDWQAFGPLRQFFSKEYQASGDTNQNGSPTAGAVAPTSLINPHESPLKFGTPQNHQSIPTQEAYVNTSSNPNLLPKQELQYATPPRSFPESNFPVNGIPQQVNPQVTSVPEGQQVGGNKLPPSVPYMHPIEIPSKIAIDGDKYRIDTDAVDRICFAFFGFLRNLCFVLIILTMTFGLVLLIASNKSSHHKDQNVLIYVGILSGLFISLLLLQIERNGRRRL